MRTSLAMFGRLSVLAVCLIVIPLIALFGGSLPELTRTVLDRYWNGEVIAAEQTLEEAPRFEPTVAIRAPAELSHRAAAPLFREAAVEAGLPRGEQVTPAFSRQADLKAAKSQEVFPVVSSQLPTNKTQTNRFVPASAQAMPIPAGESDLASGSRFPQEIPFTAQPVSFTETGKKGSGSIAASPMAPPSSSALVPIAPVSPQEPFFPAGKGDAQADRFSQIQSRLRQLGAVYYRLETWGDRPQGFRFHCQMGIEGQSRLAQQFEATDTVAVRAMQRVLAEVESWHAQRQGKPSLRR